MEPSHDLTESVNKNSIVMVAKIESLKKWVGLFKKIKIADFMRTKFHEVPEVEEFLEHEEDVSIYDDCIFWLVLRLNVSGGDLISCKFYEKNLAKIESLKKARDMNWSNNKYKSLHKINFFGFKGTWEEVVTKILEATKLLYSETAPVPA